MAKNTKATKAQLKTLKGIWTQRTAAGMICQGPEGNTFRTLIDTRTADRFGFAKLNGNSCASLVQKGFITLLKVPSTGHSFDSYGKTYTSWVQVAVLTDAGRAAIGV